MTKRKLFSSGREVLLSALTTGGAGVIFDPVQIQQILFDLTEDLKPELSRVFFDFESYESGPFDQKVYDILADLAKEDYIEILPGKSYNRYILKEKGIREGKAILSGIEDEKLKRDIEKLTNWAVNCNFDELVSNEKHSHAYI